MLTSNYKRKKNGREPDDIPFAIESLALFLLMSACIVVLFYSIIEIILFIEKNVDPVAMP